jgi:hypothetical protein
MSSNDLLGCVQVFPQFSNCTQVDPMRLKHVALLTAQKRNEIVLSCVEMKYNLVLVFIVIRSTVFSVFLLLHLSPVQICFLAPFCLIQSYVFRYHHCQSGQNENHTQTGARM